MITVISKNTTNSKLFDSKVNDFNNTLYELEKFLKDPMFLLMLWKSTSNINIKEK